MHEEGRIKLLFIVSSLAFGGAEKQTVTLVNGLDTRRFKSSLAYLKDEETLLSQIRQQCSAVNAFCCNVRRRVDPAAIRLLARHIRREQIDIIVCANPYSLMYGWLARIASGRRPRVVEVFHTTQLDTVKSRLEMLFYRPFIGISDMLVYVSENQQRFWRARALRARKDMTIHNGIDVEHFADRYTEHEKSEARKTYGFTDSDFVVGLCAAMRPEKAHGDLLKAVSLARKRGENVKCLLIGDGPERARIEEKIRELQLRSHVVITGFIADVRMLLATCDAIALVSHSIETFSIAALEAMAMGKPMLMSRTGGADEQVSHGQNGFLFTPRNVEELASHMVAVARAGTTRDMGRLARDRVVSQFSVQRMLAAYQALFVDLVPKRGKDELANWPNP